MSENELYYRSSHIQPSTDNVGFYSVSDRLLSTYAMPYSNQVVNTETLPLSINICYIQLNHGMAIFNQSIDNFNHTPENVNVQNACLFTNHDNFCSSFES